jgi:hypothetical protein
MRSKSQSFRSGAERGESIEAVEALVEELTNARTAQSDATDPVFVISTVNCNTGDESSNGE